MSAAIESPSNPLQYAENKPYCHKNLCLYGIKQKDFSINRFIQLFQEHNSKVSKICILAVNVLGLSLIVSPPMYKAFIGAIPLIWSMKKIILDTWKVFCSNIILSNRQLIDEIRDLENLSQKQRERIDFLIGYDEKMEEMLEKYRNREQALEMITEQLRNVTSDLEKQQKELKNVTIQISSETATVDRLMKNMENYFNKKSAKL